MSTVIIGGGDDARAAIEAAEKASLNGMNDADRSLCEDRLAKCAAELTEIAAKYGVQP
jgi:hypothetical protein